jgi:hypothetical protein
LLVAVSSGLLVDRAIAAMWTAEGSFIPPCAQRELRDFTRHRTQLVEEKTRTINRIQKVLADANIKLASVASDVMGVSGRAMIQRLIEGETNPYELANLAQRQLRGKIRPQNSFVVALKNLGVGSSPRSPMQRS